MNRIPGWVVVVLILVLLFAPAALGDFLSQVAAGLQTAFQGLGL